MPNHLHVVLRMRPELAAGWSNREVVCRWLTIWPRERLPDGTAVLRKAGIDARRSEADRAGWLTPVICCQANGTPLSLDEYLTLVDRTGRIIRQGKRGSIPSDLLLILQRLDIDVDRWVACMLGWRQFLGGAVGGLAARMAEATRRGLQWVQNRCGLFAAPGST